MPSTSSAQLSQNLEAMAKLTSLSSWCVLRSSFDLPYSLTLLDLGRWLSCLRDRGRLVSADLSESAEAELGGV